MKVHNRLKTMFPFADNNLSVANLSNIINIMYMKKKGNVYTAAFSRDLKKSETVRAFDLLANELYTYLNDTNVETQNSFDEWHNRVCLAFLNVLNEDSSKEKQYGKAQKALNMAMKYAYCCNDAAKTIPYNKFTHAHMALDGYTCVGANRQDYPLSFCRDVVFIQRYGRHPRGRIKSWARLTPNDYLENVTDIRAVIDAHPHTFNDYLSVCHSAGLFLGILPLPEEDDRQLTVFEAEFFIWELCKNNKNHALQSIFN